MLVIGAEKLSAITNWKDRNTCVLFGDGAGRGHFAEPAAFARAAHHGAGRGRLQGGLLSMPGGGSRPGLATDRLDGLHFLRMDGKETFKNAVQAMCSAANEVLARCEIDITRIKCVIPHQANRRIIDAVGNG